jgi:hypothetical protein
VTGVQTCALPIWAEMLAFYQQKYPQVLQTRRAEFDAALDLVCGIYDRGVFPAMHVDFRTYASNIGHRSWPGCFRCHDGDHVDAAGKELAHDCGSTCHTMPQRGLVTPLGVVPATPVEGSEWHPWQMPKEHLSIEGHDKVLCFQCHASGQRPSRECIDCHR